MRRISTQGTLPELKPSHAGSFRYFSYCTYTMFLYRRTSMTCMPVSLQTYVLERRKLLGTYWGTQYKMIFRSDFQKVIHVKLYRCKSFHRASNSGRRVSKFSPGFVPSLQKSYGISGRIPNK